MEAILELLAGFGVDKAELITIIVGVVILALRAWLGNKKVEAALEVAHNVYAVIEKTGSTKLKKLVSDSISNAATDRPEVAVINELLTAAVDPKKDLAEVDKKVPAIKRAWRRMLAGKNLGGILLKIAAR